MDSNEQRLEDLPKISVIVPVYNSEKYLEECIESLRNQTLRELEIILVDDGSTDSSSEICDNLKSKDNRIRVIHQSNKGICNARNKGIELANAEFITFCDNDDYVGPNCYKIAYESAINRNVDVVRFRRKHLMISKYGTITTSYPWFESKQIFINDWSDYIEIITKTGYGVWSGIYKKSLIIDNNIKYREEVKYGFEDHIFVSEICKFAENVYLLDNELYNWKQRVSHSTSLKKGYNVFLNRMEGFLLWTLVEGDIHEKLTDDKKGYNNRQIDYMRIAFEEIDRCGLRGRRAVDACKYVKDKIKFNTLDGQNIEYYAINNNKVNLFMATRYLKVILRKIRTKKER